MRRWGQFCTLSSQAPSRETRQALGALNRSAIGTQSLPIHGAAQFAHSRNAEVKPPIPIEDIVEKHLKLQVEFDNLHRLLDLPRGESR